MLITIREPKEVWKSPDGQRIIWELKDQDNNTWSTMSRKIATSEGQTMELTTRVAKSGKTFLITPPQEGYAAPGAPGAPAAPVAAPVSNDTLLRVEGVMTRLENAVERFEVAVSALWDTAAPPQLPEEDRPPVGLYDSGYETLQDDL